MMCHATTSSYSKDEWAEADHGSEGLDVSIAPSEQGMAGDQK
jgi:hypothetical protein